MRIKGRLLNNQLIIIGYLVDYKVFYKIKLKLFFLLFWFLIIEMFSVLRFITYLDDLTK
jgi:hypothetical protein